MGGFIQALGSLGGDIGGALGTLGEDTGSALGSVWNELGTGVSSLKWPSTSGGGVGWNLGTLLDLGLLGGGLIGNYQQQSRQNALNNLLSNPAALARFIQSMSHPLAAGAVAAAKNQAQASLGERGLSQSPAQSAAVYAQALAPLYQQQQDAAEQAAMSAIGSRESLLSGQHPANLAGPLAALMQRLQGPTGDPNDPTNTVPTNIGAPTLDPLGNPSPGLDPFGVITNAQAATLPPFQNPDWSQIIGGFPEYSPGYPTDIGGTQPSLGYGS